MASRSELARVPAEAVFDQLNRAIYEYVRDTNTEPTHILVDPASYMQLRNYAERMQLIRIDAATMTPRLFNLELLEVYRPRPFIAVARLLVIS
jgi:hypothetical protein